MKFIESSNLKDYRVIGVPAVSVTAAGGQGTASASKLDDKWWIERVFVREDDRGKGIGKLILNRLLALIPAADIVQVAPGGYNIPFKVQCAFYESCGFKQVDDGTWERAGCL